MNNEGSVVNASSIAGIMGFAKNAAYTATKHGTSERSTFSSLVIGH
jgi:NADP-dependent 3-hydroxy acid dehydrogenase YdfG